MSSRKSRNVAVIIEPVATMIPLSTDFCADDADVIIRAAGTYDFRVHKFILSMASPIFKDMFTLPQPTPDTSGTLPCIDVQDSAKAWENILRTIYPTLPNPTIDTLDDLGSLLFAAQAYEMRSVIETHRNALRNRVFLEKDPLRLYAIACACGFEDQATYVARNAELLTVARHCDPNDLKGLTLGAYRRLVSFLVYRDNEWHQTLEAAVNPQCGNFCSSTPAALYNGIKKHLQRPYLQVEEVYFKALEDRSRYTESGCRQRDCPFKDVKIKEFIQSRIKERERVCDRFQPEKWFA